MFRLRCQRAVVSARTVNISGEGGFSCMAVDAAGGDGGATIECGHGFFEIELLTSLVHGSDLEESVGIDRVKRNSLGFRTSRTWASIVIPSVALSQLHLQLMFGSWGLPGKFGKDCI